MDISTRDEGDWLLVQPTGEIDIATARSVESHLAANRDTILDLTKVTFMDSTGLRTVVGVHNRLNEAEHRLRIVVPDGPVERIIAITGLTDALDIVGTLEDAISSG